jgi:hypothetical protein
VIRLAARLAVSGGRESAVRLVLTALGVALGTTLLLLAASADPAIRAQQRRTAWQFTVPHMDGRPVPHDDPLLWAIGGDAAAGRTITVVQVAGTGPRSPVPLGIGHVPIEGEVHVSPALADLMAELPADQLADRFPSPSPDRIDEDFLAGPDDLVAVVGMSAEDLQQQEAQPIYEIRTDPPSYQFADFLRMGLALGAVGLIFPVLVFVGTSTRIGAARREQRFAGMRLAGATPRQLAVVAAVEAGGAGVVGAALGLVGYWLARPFAASVEIDGHPPFVSDVQVSPPLLALILVAVPLLAVVSSMVTLRRLQVTPLGVARRAVRARPTARRLLPFAVGSIGFVVSLGVAADDAGIEVLIPLMATFALMIYGIVAVGPWLTVLAAATIGRTGRRASALLAGRRLEADPAGGFRTVSGLVIAVFIASVFSGVTPAILAEADRGEGGIVDDNTLVAHLPMGATAADGASALAAAQAAGGTGGLVLRTDPDPDRPLEDPAVGRSHTVLVDCADVDLLRVTDRCPVGTTAYLDVGQEDMPPLFPAPFEPSELSAMPVELVAVGTEGSVASTDRIRTAVITAVPGARPFLGSEARAESDRQLVQLNRLVNLALIITLAIAGCGLAVSVAAGILERKRPFALLRLAGMQLRELQRTALLEATAPLLLIAGATAVLGLGTAAVTVTIAAGIAWTPPTIGYWACLATGLVVAVGLTAATLPLLARTTAPSSVRFE